MKNYIIILSIILISCGKPERTQEPKYPLPYKEKEVSYKSKDESVTLSGTLTIADNKESIAVILIAGSGPSQRDYPNSFDHKPFLVLADYLTRQGITVLRFDERGVGKSGGNYEKATIGDLANDVAGGVEYLKNTLGINKVGLIGHSEGGAIAPIASLKSKVDFLVLMAPGGVYTVERYHEHQTFDRLKKMKAPEEVQREILVDIKIIMNIVKNEINEDTIKGKIHDYLEEREAQGSEEYTIMLKNLGDRNRFVSRILDPKITERLRSGSDGRDILKRVRVPVLVLQGDSDALIPASTLIDAKNALDSTTVETRLFKGVNHLFMKANDLPMEKYKDISETIDPEVLKSISGFILKQ